MYRRHRLGDRPQLHRLRPARQRRHHRACTKAPRTAPKEDRFWEIIEKYQVTIFYTAPTAIRAFIKWGDQHGRTSTTSSSLRLLGSVGEPINPEAWMWYHEVIGKGNAARSSIPGGRPKPACIMMRPCPAPRPPSPARCDQAAARRRPRHRRQGRQIGASQGRRLPRHEASRGRPCCGRSTATTNATARTTASQVPGVYFTADGARQDEDGYFWVMGRVDDVLNVAGHRLSTMEVESALVSHPKVAEAAVVGKPDDIKGEGIVCFVTLDRTHQPSDELKKELKDHVAKEIGALARPDEIRFTDSLPKTRSGKIMRRLLRDIAAGRTSTGDTTTLEDYSVLAKLREEEE